MTTYDIGPAVKNLLARGRERGFVTYDELNAALPQDRISSEQIEDTMTALSEMGINLVEFEGMVTKVDPPVRRPWKPTIVR